MPQEWILFLKDNYFVGLYGLTFIIAVLSYKKYFDTHLKYLPMLIAYTFFNELLGYFIRHTDAFSFFSDKKYINANDIIYNIYSLIFFGFFYFIYWKIVKKEKFKKWIFYAAVITLLVYIINTFFQNPLLFSLYYAIAIGSWVLLFCIILYFYELRQSPKWTLRYKNLLFWISIGLGAFYFFFPICYLIGFLNTELWLKMELRTVLRILIVVMYSFFSIGFIVSKRGAFH